MVILLGMYIILSIIGLSFYIPAYLVSLGGELLRESVDTMTSIVPAAAAPPGA